MRGISPWGSQSEALVDGRIDVGYLRRPFDDRGVHSVAVGEEGAVVLAPVSRTFGSSSRLPWSG